MDLQAYQSSASALSRSRISRRSSTSSGGAGGGAGASFLPDLVNEDIDAYITGDAKHNDFLDSIDYDISLLAAGHYETETVSMPVLLELLKQEFPDFDLMAEVQSNPAFARMTGPDGGLTVRQAYMALHGDELMNRRSQAIEERTKQNMSRAIQAGAMRPQENGMTGTGGGLQNIDPAHMTREQRLEIRRRVKAGDRIAFK